MTGPSARERRITGLLSVVPVIVTTATAVVIAWEGYHSGQSYEQNDAFEQSLAAGLFSFPFWLVSLVQIIGAVGLVASRRRGARVGCVALTSVSPVLLMALVMWLVGRNESAGYETGRWPVALAAALFLPLVPLWVAVLTERPHDPNPGKTPQAPQGSRTDA